ncbi:MAG: hypothetical protein R3282_06955 [Rhodothermales bacterium]|nr:hypothetical protein [Rhodothermales bacterium]
MNRKVSWQLLVAFGVLACLHVSETRAIPVNLDSPFIFRDNRGGPAISASGTGDFIQIDVGSLPTSVPPGTTATAQNLTTGEIFPLVPCLDTRDRCAFFGLIPYSTDNANADWEVTALNGPDSDTLIVGAFGTGPGSGRLPFLENVQAIDTSVTPTFTWDLPVELVEHLESADCPSSNGFELNDCNVDRLRVRVRDTLGGVSNNEIFDTSVDLGLSLPLDATSYTLPGGIITEPGLYAVAIMMEGFDPFTRSRHRVFFEVTDVSEPHALLLVGLGLLALAFAARPIEWGHS